MSARYLSPRRLVVVAVACLFVIATQLTGMGGVLDAVGKLSSETNWMFSLGTAEGSAYDYRGLDPSIIDQPKFPKPITTYIPVDRSSLWKTPPPFRDSIKPPYNEDPRKCASRALYSGRRGYVSMEDPHIGFRGLTNLLLVAAELLRVALFSNRVAVLPPSVSRVLQLMDMRRSGWPQKLWVHEDDLRRQLQQQGKSFETTVNGKLRNIGRLRPWPLARLQHDVRDWEERVVRLPFTFMYFPVSAYPQEVDDCSSLARFTPRPEILRATQQIVHFMRTAGHDKFHGLHLRAEADAAAMERIVRPDVIQALMRQAENVAKRSGSTAIYVASGKLDDTIIKALREGTQMPVYFKNSVPDAIVGTNSTLLATFQQYADSMKYGVNSSITNHSAVVRVTNSYHALVEAHVLKMANSLTLTDYSSLTATILGLWCTDPKKRLQMYAIEMGTGTLRMMPEKTYCGTEFIPFCMWRGSMRSGGPMPLHYRHYPRGEIGWRNEMAKKLNPKSRL